MVTPIRRRPLAARKRILVASSDRATATFLHVILEQANHVITAIDDVLDAVISIEHGQYDMIVLDVSNTQTNGFAACAQLRLLSHLPILLINASRDIDLLIYGFKMGADDYMIKPIDSRELVARVNALLRRGDPQAWSGEILIQDLWIDLTERRVKVGEREVRLSPIEFNLLAFMASRPGYIFSRHDLFHSVWRAKYVESSNMVDVCIRRLREKLEQNPNQPSYVLTVRGVGYCVRGDEVDGLTAMQASDEPNGRS
ncbi:MAG: DNA-binding response regulator [Candidatus Chloroheliales bacterium]|nr:MAG: DNA-binding response regulator [Chloroflexota bacterium]